MNSPFVSATGHLGFLHCYDSLVQLFACQQTYIQHVLEIAAAQPASSILDVGCGTGTLAICLAGQEHKPRVCALDADRRMLAQASQKAGATTSIDWLLGSATRLPIADASIGLVTCSLVLHHLTQQEKQLALAEVERVLVPGGRFLLIDYCRPRHWLARLQFLPVRVADGWARTRCNVNGRLPNLQRRAGLETIEETLVINTPLGTLRSYLSRKSKTRNRSGRGNES